MSFKILVVDDEQDVESLIRQRFRKKIREGEFNFVFALNGQEALDKLKDDPDINIVMSDINMPVMDGLTLLARLSDVNRILKAVIVSAYGDMTNIRTAMNRGAYDFLIKPIDFEDFEITLKKAIHDLEVIQQGLKAKEQLNALQSELTIAARIQQSMLPKSYQTFPGRTDFEVSGAMLPAREVGGDFYDFFLIDPDHLGFIIGDVSGKGIPAALLMAVSRTLLKAIALQGAVPGQTVQYMNAVLVNQSDPAMFVTLFYGILNTRTGELRYCIAGHNPPYLLLQDGSLRTLDSPVSLVVGAFEGADYQTGVTTLAAGDAIVMYTDGVTEAQDPAGKQFGNTRLAELLIGSKGLNAKELVQRVIQTARSFSSNQAQSDDITALVLRRS